MARLATIGLARHMTADGMHPGELLSQEILAGLRASHDAQLADRDLEGRLAWALDRIHQLEARLLVLQGAMLSLTATRGGEASPEPAAAPVATSALAPARPTAREANLRFDAGLRCQGFYDAEIRQDRPPLRWIGPATVAELWLPRVESPLELRFMVAGLFVPEVLNEIRFSVDGGPWIRPEVQGTGGNRALVLRPPPGPNQTDEMMRVAIDAVLQDSPANRGGQDKRKLSIAFSRLEARRIG